MPQLTSRNEIGNSVGGFDYFINNLPTAEIDDNASALRLSFFGQHGLLEPDSAVDDTAHDRIDGDASSGSSTPLSMLPFSPWRSFGGYLDYSGWAARERFLELDKAIAAVSYSRVRAS
jgi:hypothetical protein